MENKAWIKIAEAFLAIVIIIGAFLLIIGNQNKAVNADKDVYETQRAILDLISKNTSLRTEVLNNNNENINKTIEKLIPNTWKFETKICNLNDACGASAWKENLYVEEIMITANLTDYNPKKLRFFVWFE